MGSISKALLIIIIILVGVTCTEGRRSGSRSSRYRYSGYYSSGGGGGSSLAGIIIGSIFGGIIILIVIFWTYKICKARNCSCSCISKIKERLKRTRITRSQPKPKFILRKDTVIQEDKAVLTLKDTNKTSLPKVELTPRVHQVSSVQGKTPNVTRNIYSIANVVTKAKSIAKKSSSRVSDKTETNDTIPDVAPPSYEELEYKPVYGNLNGFSKSNKPAYPPPAYDYDFN